ncbi:MAG TPA: hypothetical protein VFG30_43325 [Polyangiales bacterium]|nr:hypothetical protein [Polyangiales bacterium]
MFGLACGLPACAPGSVVTPQLAGGANAVAAGGSGGSPAPRNESGMAGLAGTGGSQSSGASGIGRPPMRDGGIDSSVAGGAALVPDASTVDAARGEVARDAASPGGDAAAGSDASVDVPQTAGCAGSMFALCDDFESGALDTKLWKLTQSKGTVVLDSSRANRGSKYSVHVHVDSGSDTTVGVTESTTFPALKAGLFARAFIFIPGAMATSLFNGDRHSRLIYAQGATPYGEYALGIWSGGLIQNHYSKSDDSQDTKMLPPFDQWFCLEYELDSAAGNVKAYLNDVEIMALRHDGWPASNIDTLMFGVDRYGSFPVAEDIWFDDLVVDSKRIGCAR